MVIFFLFSLTTCKQLTRYLMRNYFLLWQWIYMIHCQSRKSKETIIVLEQLTRYFANLNSSKIIPVWRSWNVWKFFVLLIFFLSQTNIPDQIMLSFFFFFFLTLIILIINYSTFSEITKNILLRFWTHKKITAKTTFSFIWEIPFIFNFAKMSNIT